VERWRAGRKCDRDGARIVFDLCHVLMETEVSDWVLETILERSWCIKKLKTLMCTEFNVVFGSKSH
jgi:hypothetical protein